MAAKTSSALGFFPHLCHPRIKRAHGRLPLLESVFYLVSGIGSILYVTYHLYRASDKYANLLTEDDFVSGWSFLGRKKDISNYEWHFWSSYFWKILPFGLGHILIGQLVHSKFFEYRKHVFLVYSLLSVTYLLGYRTVLFFVSHSCICYLASSVGSFIFVWIVSLLLLSTLNYSPFNPVMMRLCGISNDPDSFYLFVFVLAFVILRYTSFCLERSKRLQEKCEEEADLVETHGFLLFDLLVYVFYIPTFFTGPLITYDQFRIQINSKPAPWTRQRLITSIKGFTRVFFWAIFLEFSHHFLYYNSLPRNIGVLRDMSAWAMVGIGYMEGQYFMLKYLIMYDLPGQVARLDNLDPPLGPKCISYIYRYSDMWKYFDRGLYTFLKNYIYIPMGGSQTGMVKRLFASLLCFLYIYMWHGQEYYLLLWSLANYLGCSLELIGGQLEKTKFVTSIKTDYLSPAMVRRIRCIAVVPLFLMSCFAIFYFFGGVYVGDMFLERLLTQASHKSRIVLYFLIYANLQNAMEVERWLTLRHMDKTE